MTEQPRTPQECRKFYEGALASLSVLADEPHRQFRERVKYYLIRKGVIQKSTTELQPAQLEAMAEAMTKYFTRTNATPPEERGVFHLDLIFKDLIK